MSELCLKIWANFADPKFIEWFSEAYLDELWLNWFIGSPGKYNVNVENNSIESYNANIKKLMNTSVSVTVERFFDTGIRSILCDAVDIIDSYTSSLSIQQLDRLDLIRNYRIPQGIMNKALLLVQDDNQYLFDVGKKLLFVNSSKNIANKVTSERCDKYHSGKLNIQEIQILNDFNLKNSLHDLTSLHAVNEHGECDCKNYHITGYLCSHTLVHYHSIGIINIIDMTRRVDNRLSGRKRNRSSALSRELTEYEESSTKITRANDYFQRPILFEEYGFGVIVEYIGLEDKWLALFLNVPNVNLMCECGNSNCGNGKIHLMLKSSEVEKGFKNMEKTYK